MTKETMLVVYSEETYPRDLLRVLEQNEKVIHIHFRPLDFRIKEGAEYELQEERR